MVMVRFARSRALSPQCGNHEITRPQGSHLSSTMRQRSRPLGYGPYQVIPPVRQHPLSARQNHHSAFQHTRRIPPNHSPVALNQEMEVSIDFLIDFSGEGAVSFYWTMRYARGWSQSVTRSPIGEHLGDEASVKDGMDGTRCSPHRALGHRCVHRGHHFDGPARRPPRSFLLAPHAVAVTLRVEKPQSSGRVLR